MKLKKIAAAMLAAVMLAVSTASGALPDPLSVTANAAETLVEGDYEYTVNSDGETATITSYIGTAANLTVPSALGGKKVAIIGDYAFSDSQSLVSVTIPEGVTNIGKCCFSLCTNITSITLPNSLTNIGAYAFDECKQLTSITIPNGVKNIESGVFSNCYGLKTIIIPNSVTSIGYCAFAYCTSLTSIVLPDSLTNIESSAFWCDWSLTSIIINNATSIGVEAFYECKNLTSITIPESVKSIDRWVFLSCKNLKDIYYGGSESQWKTIDIHEENDELFNATIHFAKEDEEESDTSSEPTSSDTSSEPTSSDTSSAPTSTPTSRPTSNNSTTTSEETTSELPSPDIPTPDSGDFREENEVTGTVEPSPDAAGVPSDDRITSITINPAFNMKNKNGNDVELDLSKITVKASEIYDEEGLKRAEEALGETLKGNKKYNLLDLTLLYNGEDFSNGYEGLVKVIIPIPKGHRDKTFSCYRLTEINGKPVKQLIPGVQTEDSYIIYLEHFSLYALVSDGDTPRSAAPGLNPTTGVAMAAVPVAMLAAAVVVIAKKRK